MTVATDSVLLKLMGPSAFIPAHKLCLHDKLSMYNFKLCITKYSRLFIDMYVTKNSKMSDTSETFSNSSRQCL